jgi:hypothetical protein
MPPAAAAALSRNTQGRTIKVNEAQPPGTGRAQYGGGGRGGYGGGGYGGESSLPGGRCALCTGDLRSAAWANADAACASLAPTRCRWCVRRRRGLWPGRLRR